MKEEEDEKEEEKEEEGHAAPGENELCDLLELYVTSRMTSGE